MKPTRAVRHTLVLVLLLACKSPERDRSQQAPPAAASDAGVSAASLDACRAAAARAQTLAASRRAQALIDGCRPCGDWDPVLRWNTPAADGGPSRAAIDQAMHACNAYCDPNAKQRFLGTLDDTRGRNSRLPWRELGEVCKAGVSAVPDARYMSAPYFALDRIARALGAPSAPTPAASPASPAAPAAATGALSVALPALTISGVGPTLPPAAGPTAAPGSAAITVDANQMLLGTLPLGTLSATGVQVAGDYPGAPIAPEALAAALAAPALAGQPIAVLAPLGLPATRLAAVAAAAGGHELRLAVAVPGPVGWSLPAVLPIALVAAAGPAGPWPAGAGAKLLRPASGTPPGRTLVLSGPDADAAILAARAASPEELHTTPPTIVLDTGATITSLARVLEALVALGAPSAAIVDAQVARAIGKPPSRHAATPGTPTTSITVGRPVTPGTPSVPSKP